MENTENLSRNCPNPTINSNCRGRIQYKSKYSYIKAIKSNSLCQSCLGIAGSIKGNQKKRESGNWGIETKRKNETLKHTNETKIKISETQVNQYQTGARKPWNKGLSKEIDTRVAKTGKSRPGELNPMSGTSYLKKWIDQFGIETAQQMNAKTTEKKRHVGQDNGMFGTSFIQKWNERYKESEVLEKLEFRRYKQSGSKLTYDDWKSFDEVKTSQYQKYKKQVQYYTNKNDISILPNYEKRGKAGIVGAYQLDHIISINYGFKNDINPKNIGSIENLWFVPWEINVIKKDSKSILTFLSEYYPISQYGKYIYDQMAFVMKYYWNVEIQLPKLKHIEK